MKNIFILSLLFLSGCVNNKIDNSESPVSSFSTDKTVIEITSGSLIMNVTKPYYVFAEDVVIDLMPDGSIYTTYTDFHSGNRVTIKGGYSINNLKDYHIRDWTKDE